ncbi:MAG: hypothetical protein ILP16_10135 [Spirochaetales bacterium]|nr:hypothetical protein [Spirochaetales bacterium]
MFNSYTEEFRRNVVSVVRSGYGIANLAIRLHIAYLLGKRFRNKSLAYFLSSALPSLRMMGRLTNTNFISMVLLEFSSESHVCGIDLQLGFQAGVLGEGLRFRSANAGCSVGVTVCFAGCLFATRFLFISNKRSYFLSHSDV